MRLTRRGFLGSMLGVVVAGLGGFLGLAQADVEPVFDTKDAKFKATFRNTPKPIGGTLADARREIHKLKDSRGRALARSAHRTQERIAADVFNNAFEAHDYWGFR